MPDRDGYIPGVPCWIDTSQPDPDAAAAFYGGLFGWDAENVSPAGSGAKYLIARLRGGDVAAIASLAPGAPPTAMWNTYICVESADEAAAKVAAAGGGVLTPPFDVTSAGRMAVLADPEGATFMVWQAGEHEGARIVNEPGSLNFNVLSTRETARAHEFYGAVFAWEPLDTGSGGAMWRLPGYGEFLERSDPGLRRRMADAGAPAGFADVVAALSVIPDGERETPAHWGVTFTVEDADATAERAGALGGRVVVPAFDAPWVRMTVIRDPQGAMFTASKFVPENRDVAAEPDAAATAA